MYLVSWDCLLAVKVQVYLETSQNYSCTSLKNWTLAMMLKALPLALTCGGYCC